MQEEEINNRKLHLDEKAEERCHLASTAVVLGSFVVSVGNCGELMHGGRMSRSSASLPFHHVLARHRYAWKPLRNQRQVLPIQEGRFH